MIIFHLEYIGLLGLIGFSIYPLEYSSLFPANMFILLDHKKTSVSFFFYSLVDFGELSASNF